MRPVVVQRPIFVAPPAVIISSQPVCQPNVDVDVQLCDIPGNILDTARREAYLRTGPEMVGFLERHGMAFQYADGWPDYYDERPGGQPRGGADTMPAVVTLPRSPVTFTQ